MPCTPPACASSAASAADHHHRSPGEHTASRKEHPITIDVTTIRYVPIVNTPEVTLTLSNCVLCLCPIAKVPVAGGWIRLNWSGAPVPGGVLCETTTGEVTGHQPEPPLTWAERWDATVHIH